MTLGPDKPTLHDWLEDTIGPSPDPEVGARQVMARLPETRQVRRWLPFPVSSRDAKTPTPSDTTDYQPSLIPATNGHTPAVIGRTQTMLSPAKAITAGVLVFAIGGALLIAQPLQQPRSVPGAETDTEVAAPAEFTGSWFFSSELLPATTWMEGGVGRSTDAAWRHSTRDITDPRFDGEVTIFANSDTYLDANYQLGYAVTSAAWRIENENGAWQSEPTVGIDFPDGSATTRFTTFHGEGAYEGLTALVQLSLTGSGWDLRGVILDGDAPPDPDPRSIE